MGRIRQETDLVFSSDWRGWVHYQRILAVANYSVEKIKTHCRISVLSPIAIQREPATGILRMLPLAGREMYREFFLIHRKEKYLSPAAHVFIKSRFPTQRQ
jgi:DNA-binding transcriptional LysR family regulator